METKDLLALLSIVEDLHVLVHDRAVREGHRHPEDEPSENSLTYKITQLHSQLCEAYRDELIAQGNRDPLERVTAAGNA